MKWIALVGVLVVTSSAQAQPPEECAGSWEPACSHTFIARQEPSTYVAIGEGNWGEGYASYWTSQGERFITDDTGCRMYGHRGPIYVKETMCDGRLVVTVRSTSGPISVTFWWSVLR